MARVTIYAEDSPRRFPSMDSQLEFQAFASVPFYIGWQLDNNLGISSVIPSRLHREVKFGRNTSLREDYIPILNKFGPAFLGENAMYFGCVSAGTCVASQCVEGSCKVPTGDFLFLSSASLHSEAIEATCRCPSDSSSAHTSQGCLGDRATSPSANKTFTNTRSCEYISQ